MASPVPIGGWSRHVVSAQSLPAAYSRAPIPARFQSDAVATASVCNRAGQGRL